MTRQIPLPDNKPPRLADFPYPRIEVICNKCGRAGSYDTSRLIAKHGGATTFLELRRYFEGTCSRSNDIARLNEVCGVMFPDLVRWQLGN